MTERFDDNRQEKQSEEARTGAVAYKRVGAARTEVGADRRVGAARTEIDADKWDGRFNRRAVSVEEAQRRVLAAAVRLAQASELAPLAECGGRRLAKSLTATSDWPPFARSGLDGYAVRAADTALATPVAPAALRVVDCVAAGGLACATLQAGTAARIMTGAAVPEGADAVVMLEQTAEALLAGGGKAALVKAPALPGQNVAPRGEEFRLGSPLAEPGTMLRPGHVALLGTFGYAAVPVYKRPRVAIFATGGELLPVSAPLAPGRIRDSNSAMIAAMTQQCGAVPVLCGTLPDDPAELQAALSSASEQFDCIITTGGVSVGDYDAMAEIFRSMEEYREDAEGSGEAAEAQGADLLFARNDTFLLFNRIAMRPGSPTSGAIYKGKLLLALSGNPGACFVGFELLARPALRRMQGELNPMPRIVSARLAADFGKPSPHTRYVRARLRQEEDGGITADALGFAKSSMMASIADADGLVVIPAGSRGALAGETVDVVLLP